MKSYTMTAEQADRYDDDDVSVYDEILEGLGISEWTPEGQGDGIEIYHPDGFVAIVFNPP